MKKGQITIFVIMGLVLILIVGLVLFTTKFVKDAPPVEKEIENSFEQAKVKEYVEKCLEYIGEEGLLKLGSNGGYINPENYGFIAFNDMPTVGSALSFSPGSDYIIPYWNYLKSSNSCETCFFNSGKPPIEKIKGSKSVEQQLMKYIDENLENCLDLSQFKDMNIEAEGEPKSNVFVGGSSIILSLDYPLIIKYNEDSSKVTEFESAIDIDLNKFFDLAEVIMNMERESFFASATTEIIAINGLDETIPPIAGEPSIKFGAPKIWMKSEVSEVIKAALADNIPNIQILGSKDSSFFNSDDNYFSAFYRNFQTPIDFDAGELSDIEIDFLYLPWWEPYLKVLPGSGEVIRETPWMNTLVIQVMFVKNQFYYDISYPIVVSLSDSESLNGKGYTLNFAFEVNVRANQALTVQDEEDTEIENIFVPARNLFYNPDNWNSGEITIKTVNPQDNSYVKDLSLTYTCGTEELFLGNSIMYQEGFAGMKTKLPVCIGGFISGLKKDYFVTSEKVDTFLDIEDEVIINAQQKKTMSVLFNEKIVGKEPDGTKLKWTFKPSSDRSIGLDQKVIMIMTREGEVNEDEFIGHVIFYGNQTTSPKVDLVTGKYTIEAFLLSNDVIIPEQEICVQDGLFSETCKTIPKLEFNESFYSGGLNLNSDTIGFFEVTADDLTKDTLKVTLLALEADDFDKAEDLEQIDKINQYVIDNEEYFMPTFE
ncbi:MAG: hypothetical protein ABH828_04510 [archaeon]